MEEVSPKVSEIGTPRFVEHFNEPMPTPPYQQHFPREIGGEDAPIPMNPDAAAENGYYKMDRMGSQAPTEVASPIPESFKPDREEKEVVIPPLQPDRTHSSADRTFQRRRYCGLPLLWLLIIAGLVLALAVGLGVGLGVGLNRNTSTSKDAQIAVDDEYLIGGAISPEYFSTQGAFNGSGIALASQSFSRSLEDGTQGSLVMYFQYHNGDIRWMQLSSRGDWVGGDISTVVADDAKNSTPLSAVSYVLDGASTWHVFYISKNNTIRQRTNSNTSNVWTDGPINAMNIQVWDADLVGMQACWYGNDYGDSDYAHSPLPNNGTNATISTDVGMHLWYASDATTFQQLGWRDGENTWMKQDTFPNMNGHAGVGCYSWGPGTVTYVMMVNQQNVVEVFWKDTDTNLTSSASHPINEWVSTSMSIPNVDPATSLGYTNYLYVQDATTHMINGYNITWAAENSTIDNGGNFTVSGAEGLSGTHLSVSTLPNSGGGNNVVVFYQTNGSDVSEYTRDLIAGQWTSVNLQMPN